MPKPFFFYTHLVVGLAVGALLVCAGLTGSLLVWRNEIDVRLHPHLMRVDAAGERAPLEQAVQAVRRAYPELAPARLQLPRAPGETLEVTTAGAHPLQVYVDPYRATVLGARGADETFANWLFDLHVHLLSGETGERVMGTAGLLLLVLVGTGLVVWWPGVRRVGDAVAIRWRAGWKRVNFDLHRATGFWSTLFLVLVAVTGSSLVFHDAYMAGLNRLTASPPRPTPPEAPPTGRPPLSVDQLLRAAAYVVPDGEPTYLTLPTQPGHPAVLRKKLPSELHPNGRSFIYLHPETGSVLAVEEAARAPLGTRAYNVLYPLHIGRWGGLASRLLYTLLGLTPAVLAVSGALMWWNRQGRRLVSGKRSVRADRPPARPQARAAAR